MQGIHIVATGRALPKKVVTNEDMSKIVETNDEWIRTRTGIGQRHFCEEETCQSLAIEAATKAVEKAMTTSGFSKDRIGFVLVATTTPDKAFPSVACMVQKALGLPKEVMSFDIQAACSGFLYGVGICRGLLTNSEKKYGLVIGSEQLSRILDFEDRGSCILFGDGAGAAIIELADTAFAYRGWSDGNDEVLYCHGVGFEDNKLHMEGNAVFRFAVKAIEEGVETILEDAKLTMAEIDYVVCHQANQRIIDHVAKKYQDYDTPFYKNIERYANTSAASIPIALDEMMEKNLLQPGMKVICVGFGAGFTWSGMLFTV